MTWHIATERQTTGNIQENRPYEAFCQQSLTSSVTLYSNSVNTYNLYITNVKDVMDIFEYVNVNMCLNLCVTLAQNDGVLNAYSCI